MRLEEESKWKWEASSSIFRHLTRIERQAWGHHKAGLHLQSWVPRVSPFPVSRSQVIFSVTFFFFFKEKIQYIPWWNLWVLLNSFSITLEWGKWGEEKTCQLLSTILFSANFLNHDGNCPDESNILHVEMMVFYVNASQSLMRIGITAWSDSLGLGVHRRVCISNHLQWCWWCQQCWSVYHVMSNEVISSFSSYDTAFIKHLPALRSDLDAELSFIFKQKILF